MGEKKQKAFVKATPVMFGYTRLHIACFIAFREALKHAGLLTIVTSSFIL